MDVYIQTRHEGLVVTLTTHKTYIFTRSWELCSIF